MFKKLITIVITVCLISQGLVIPAAAYEKRTYARTGDIGKTEYESILSVLRNHEAQAGAPGGARLFDTGIHPEDAESAYRLINAFKALYQGDKDFAIIYNEEGWSNPTVTVYTTSDGASEISTDYAGTRGDRPAIYAGWLPDADSKGSLKKHDDVWAALTAAAETAPADRNARYRYYMDYLCSIMTPGSAAGEGQASPSSAQESGSSSGYAGRYFALCSMSGDDCLHVPVKGSGNGNGVYFRNAVEDIGRYYWIDSCMADMYGEKGYFMVPVSDTFTEVFTGPYIIK